MSNKMLIDATHPEETRVVIVRDKRVEDFDFETASKKPLRGNIYLAKVTRVEPSLQAAFVEYGGNRHGFLAFSEIHPDYYQIPQADRAALIADLHAAAEEPERRASSGGNSGTGGGGRRRRGRGDRREERPAEASGTEDGTGGNVEVVGDDDTDEIEEVGAEAADRDEADEPSAQQRAAEEAEDAEWLRAVAQDSAAEADDDGDDGDADRADEDAPTAAEAVPSGAARVGADEEPAQREKPAGHGARREVSETGEVASGDIVRESVRGVSSDEAPASLDRARRQVEENIEADVEAARDEPIRAVEVEPTFAPDADAQSRTGADDRDPPVARNAAVADTADAPDTAGEVEAPAKPRRARKPSTARPRKAAKAPAEEPAEAAAPEPAAAAAPEAAEPTDPAPEDEGGEAPKKRRRAPARRTTKKSDTGLADPAVSDDDEDGGENGSLESVGGDDLSDEIPERRRLVPRKQYKIQEVIKRRQILLVQVVKEERGTKGAALTTYLSLAGRFSVLMPNTDRGGGVSRKITDQADRRRLKELVEELEVPQGMGIILRTAGANRTTTEIRRDFEYLTRLWESVRDLTLKSIAPALVYEEGDLVKRAIRDQYTKEIDEILVSGDTAFEDARDFMRMLMPGHDGVVKPYRDATPIFTRFGVESQLDAMFSPQVTLPSKGYIVINPTEALVSIDVNSGRSTKEHSIEDTALKTNLEAADEVARQLRLRDLAGLIVIDFIDMDERRNDRQVEARLKNALKLDRSRIQIGRISPFGLLEMSRQRTRQGMIETSMVACTTCGGTGHVRSTQSVALHCLRMLEEHLLTHGEHNVTLKTSSAAALYILNQKRSHLHQLEEAFGLEIEVHADETLSGQHLEIVAGAQSGRAPAAPAARITPDVVAAEDLGEFEAEPADEERVQASEQPAANGEGSGRRRKRRRRRGGSGDGRGEVRPQNGRDENGAADDVMSFDDNGTGSDDDDDDDDDDARSVEDDAEVMADAALADEASGDDGQDEPASARRRGRRGGRRHRRDGDERSGAADVEIVEDVAEAFDEDGADEDALAAAAMADDAVSVGDADEAAIDSAMDDFAEAAAGRDLADAALQSSEPVPAGPAPERKSDPRPPRAGWWKPRLFS